MAHDPTDSDEWWGPEYDRRFDVLRRGWKPPFPLPQREPNIPQPAPDNRGELGPFGAFWLGVALGAVLAGFAVGLWVAR